MCIKYQQQLDEIDCGPAYIAMIASYFKSFVSLARVRELAKTDFDGTNLDGMIHAAEELGFDAVALHGNSLPPTWDKIFSFPFIAHLKSKKTMDTTIGHYVIIKTVKKSKLVIIDPDQARKKYTLNREAFFKLWTGYTLVLLPSTRFMPEKRKNGVISKFLPLILPQKKDIIISVISVVLIIFGIVSSFYYKYIIDEIIASKATFTLTTFSIGILILFLLQSILEAFRTILINHFSFKTSLRLNFSFILHILKLPMYVFDTRKTGEILSRLTDISKIRDLFSGILLTLALDILLVLIIGPILLKMNPSLFAITLISVILMCIFAFIFSKVLPDRFLLLRGQQAEVNASLVETIYGIFIIKAMNSEKLMRNIYEKKQMSAIWTDWHIRHIMIIQQFVTGFINNATTLLIFWAGISGIISDSFSLGSLMSYTLLMTFFVGPVFRLANVQPQIHEAIIAAERLNEILEIEPEQIEDKALLKPARIEGNIDFVNISFKYDMRAAV
jgi:ATP-binding cassette subfamily B protein